MYTFNSKTRDSIDINLYKHRIEKVRLIWPQQILDLIKFYKIKKINDLGSCYFQFYQELKKQKLNYDYFGYDIDKKFIDIGLKKFPNFKKYKICNIENFKLRSCDFSIISATLEHVQNPFKVLKNIIKSTKKIIVIRSYFGAHHHKLVQKIGVKMPVNHNQFSFKEIEDLLKKNKFKVNFILDKATNFSINSKLINGKKKNKRNIYICLAIKE
jgi:SAM-dependent methyltransferase